MSESKYIIYNASAGSGKTFTLVKSFLKIILENTNPDSFRSLLAITFTNKAVSEMKERIIEKLLLFSDTEKASSEIMFQQIAIELKLSEDELISRSEKVLKQILHNYAALTVTTIDAFNHRLIRSFAFDLKLNPNFEVFIETDEMLHIAVDNLLKKMGDSPQITQLLIEFSKSQIDDNKDWDITKKLLSVAKLLLVENNFKYLQQFENKTLDDFQELKKTLLKQRKNLDETIAKNAQNFLDFTEKYQLTEDDFNRGSILNFFVKVAKNQEFSKSFETQWAKEIEVKPLYANKIVKKSPNIASLLDEHQLEIASWFRAVETSYYQLSFVKNALLNLTPLAVLNSLRQEIEIIKEEENILPISEFNSIISKTIKNEPTPFIYEKLGQRYKHYFIDEFQDTSELQWGNVQPLIGDALQSENHSGMSGSLLLVGDAKQSIYRWRGGKAEQFMGLYSNEENPFFVEAKVADLDKNYRSYKQIIEFNNDFFGFIAKNPKLFQTELYRELYKNTFQDTHEKTKEDGYVLLSFVGTENKAQAYCDEVVLAVEDALSCGFSQRDICIVTRGNKEGFLLAQYLTEKGFQVVSSDALLLKNVPEINFLIALFNLLLEPKNQENKAVMLLLYAQIKGQENIHQVMEKYLTEPNEKFFKANNFSFEYFQKFSFYEGAVYAVERFSLAKKSDAYMAHFLDLIFDFSNGKKGSVTDFLQYWEEKSEKLSVSTPQGLNAINIMTIHKSKGLEFPVVIYAFANSEFKLKNGKMWLPLQPDQYNGFPYLLIDDQKFVKNLFPKEITDRYEKQLLDEINVLYVAMTRPKAHLYVISEVEKDTDEIKSFSQIFQAFLKEKSLWNEEELCYKFGKKVISKKENQNKTNWLKFSSINAENQRYKIVTKQGLLWDSNAENAIEKGNVTHQLLSKIYSNKDVEKVLQDAILEGIIAESQENTMREQILEIVNNDSLKDCFSGNYKVLNEQEFISETGVFYRPDRVVFDSENQLVTVIDYKTGQFYTKYKEQLQKYAYILSQLGWKVKAKYLVFIGDFVEIMEV